MAVAREMSQNLSRLCRNRAGILRESIDACRDSVKTASGSERKHRCLPQLCRDGVCRDAAGTAPTCRYFLSEVRIWAGENQCTRTESEGGGEKNTLMFVVTPLEQTQQDPHRGLPRLCRDRADTAGETYRCPSRPCRSPHNGRNAPTFVATLLKPHEHPSTHQI